MRTLRIGSSIGEIQQGRQRAAEGGNGKTIAAWCRLMPPLLDSRSQIPPRMQPVKVLKPSIPNVLSVMHVRDHCFVDRVVSLFLRGAPRRAGAADDQHDPRGAGPDPLVVELL